MAVEAMLRYLAPDSHVNRLYVAPGALRSTCTYDERVLEIGNGRAHRDVLRLDGSGFELLEHHSSVEDFSDDEELERAYIAEVVAVVQRVTGADLVVPVGSAVRRAARSKPGAAPQSPHVHVDIHPDRAPERFRSAYEEAAPGAPPFRRAVYTSFWRAVSPPPQDWPLALCDYRSIGDDEGVPSVMVRVASLPEKLPEDGDDVEVLEELGAASYFHYRPGHRWWYFPRMTSDEAILLKLNDSDHDVAWRVPHTAFRDPTVRTDVARESVEVRTIAFFAGVAPL